MPGIVGGPVIDGKPRNSLRIRKRVAAWGKRNTIIAGVIVLALLGTGGYLWIQHERQHAKATLSYSETQVIVSDQRFIDAQSGAGGQSPNEGESVSYMNLAYDYAKDGQCQQAAAAIAKARQKTPPNLMTTFTQSANYITGSCH